jgi:hypothetical protein
MLKLKDIKRDKSREYLIETEPDSIRLSLDIVGMSELLDKVGHLLVETHDGDLTGLWYSTDSEPSKNSVYEEIYP